MQMRDLSHWQKSLSIYDKYDEGPFNDLHEIQQIGRVVLEVAEKEVSIIYVVGYLLF